MMDRRSFRGWTYDPAADAIYITFAGDFLKLVTVDLTDSGAPAQVLLDVDKVTGGLAGIEIIDHGGGNLFVKLRSLLAEEPRILGGNEAE